MMSASNRKVGIIGTGLIGRSWAMLFASVGYNVYMYDISESQIRAALEDIKQQTKTLEDSKLLRGNLTASQQNALIKGTTDLTLCVRGTVFIQECVPEDMSTKRKVYQELDKIMDDSTILSSSASTFLPSKLFEGFKHNSNFIVSHPVNPPYYVPMVEIVPSPWTSDSTVTKTCSIMKEIGQVPVRLNKEIEGYVLNRLQYVLLNEAWRLVADGIVSVEGLDDVMSEGLGMRYAFLGPLETAHLNAEGMSEYITKYGGVIQSVTNTTGPTPRWQAGPEASNLIKEMVNVVPLDKLAERRAWRDACLTRLCVLKKEMSTSDSSN